MLCSCDYKIIKFEENSRKFHDNAFKKIDCIILLVLSNHSHIDNVYKAIA